MLVRQAALVDDLYDSSIAILQPYRAKVVTTSNHCTVPFAEIKPQGRLRVLLNAACLP